MSEKDQIAILKAQIKLLQEQAQANSKKTRAIPDTYQGTPVLRFEGNFKPFSLGKSKLHAVMECLDDVKAFLG